MTLTAYRPGRFATRLRARPFALLARPGAYRPGLMGVRSQSSTYYREVFGLVANALSYEQAVREQGYEAGDVLAQYRAERGKAAICLPDRSGQ